MADEEHVVVYRAIADFTNLNAEAAKAEQAMKRLGDTHATANDKIAASEGKVGKSLDERVKANERVGQSEAKLAKDIEAHQKAQRALAEEYHKHAGQSSPLQLDPKKIDEQRQALAKLREELAGAQHYLRSSQFEVEQSQKLLKAQQGRVRRASDPRMRDIEQQAIPHFEERVGITKAHVVEAEQRLSALHARTQRGAVSPTSTAAWQSMVRAEQAASTTAATGAATRAEAAARRAEDAAREVRTVTIRNAKPGMIYEPGTGHESEITRVTPGGDTTAVELANGQTLNRSPRGRIRVSAPVEPAAAAPAKPRSRKGPVTGENIPLLMMDEPALAQAQDFFSQPGPHRNRAEANLLGRAIKQARTMPPGIKAALNETVPAARAQERHEGERDNRSGSFVSLTTASHAVNDLLRKGVQGSGVPDQGVLHGLYRQTLKQIETIQRQGPARVKSKVQFYAPMARQLTEALQFQERHGGNDDDQTTLRGLIDFYTKQAATTKRAPKPAPAPTPNAAPKAPAVEQDPTPELPEAVRGKLVSEHGQVTGLIRQNRQWWGRDRSKWLPFQRDQMAKLEEQLVAVKAKLQEHEERFPPEIPHLPIGPVLSDKELEHLDRAVQNLSTKTRTYGKPSAREVGRRYGEAVRDDDHHGISNAGFDLSRELSSAGVTGGQRDEWSQILDMVVNRRAHRSMAERLRKHPEADKFPGFKSITPDEVGRLSLHQREGFRDSPEDAYRRLTHLRESGEVMPPVHSEDDEPEAAAAPEPVVQPPRKPRAKAVTEAVHKQSAARPRTRKKAAPPDTGKVAARPAAEPAPRPAAQPAPAAEEAPRPAARPAPAPEINVDDYLKVVEPVIEDIVAKAVEAKQTRQRARKVTPADMAGRVGRRAPAADIAEQAGGKAKAVDELTDAEARQEAGSHKLADAMARATDGLHRQRDATARKVPVVGDLVDAEEREATGNRELSGAIREVILAKQRHEIADKRLQQTIETGTAKDIRRAQQWERHQARNLADAQKKLRDDRVSLAEQERKDVDRWDARDRANASHADEQGRRDDSHVSREGRLETTHQQNLTAGAKRDAADLAAFVAKAAEDNRRLRARADDEEQKTHTRRLANAKKEADDHLLIEQREVDTAKRRHDFAQQRVLDEIRVGAVRAAEVRREAEEVRRAERHTSSQELHRVRLAAARPRNTGSIWRPGGGYRDRRNLGVVKTATGMGTAGKLLAQGWRDTEASGRLLERTIARLNGAWHSYRTQTAASGDGGLIAGRGMKTVADWGDRLTSSFTRMLPKLLSFRAVIVLALAALGPLVSSLGALGAGAIGVISAVGGLAGVVLALPGAFAGAAAAVGALMLAFQPMAGVLKAYNAYQDATRQGSMQLADTQRRAAEQLVDSQHGVQQASIGLQQAQFNERRSQVALNEARRQAARDLQDLRAELDRANLNEEGAVLALRRAEVEYRKVMADGNSSQLDREEALNRVKNAEFDLRDVRLKNQRLVEDAALAEKRGVQGNLQVVDARNAAENATQNVTEAVFALAKAQRDLTQTMRENAAGGGQVYTAYMKLQDELNKLGPNARTFALGLIGMGGALREVKKQVGERFFGPLLGQLGNLKSLLDPTGGIAYLLNVTAGALGNVAANAVEMVKRWQDAGDITKIADSNAISVGNLGSAALYVADAFKTIAVIAGPFTQWLTGAIKNVADQFDRWVNSAAGASKIGDYLGVVKLRMQEFGDIIKNVLSLIGSLFWASQDFTTWMMDGLKNLTAGWAAWGKEQEKPNSSFKNFLTNSKDLLKEIIGFVGAFATSLGKLAADPKNMQEAQRVFHSLAKDILPALVGIFTKLSESKAFSKIVAGLGDFLKAVDNFLANGGITPLETFINTLLKAFTKLFELLGNKTFGKYVSALLTGLAALAAVSVVLKVTGLSKLVGQLGKVTKGAFTAIGAIGKFAAFVGRQTFKGLNKLTGGRLGRGARRVTDPVTDWTLGRDRGETARRRRKRANTPGTGSRRERVTDRLTGRAAGTTRQQRALRTPVARATTVLAKIDIANGLLRKIERNTAGGGAGGGGRGKKGTKPGPTGGSGGRGRRGGTSTPAGPVRPRSGGGAGGRRRGGSRVRVDGGVRLSQPGPITGRMLRSNRITDVPGYDRERHLRTGRTYAANRRLNDPSLAFEEHPSGGLRGWRRRAADNRPERGTLDLPGVLPVKVTSEQRRVQRLADRTTARTTRETERRTRLQRQRAAGAARARDIIAAADAGPLTRIGGSLRSVRQRASGRVSRTTGVLRGIGVGAAARLRGIGGGAAARLHRPRRSDPDRLRRQALDGLDETNNSLIAGIDQAVAATRPRVDRSSPDYVGLTPAEKRQVRRREQRTSRRQRDQAQRRSQVEQVRADRTRRRAVSGIDDTNTSLRGGIDGMLSRARDRRIEHSANLDDRVNQTRASRATGALRGVGARAADRFRRVRGDDPERGALGLGATRRRREPSTTRRQPSTTRRRLRRPSVGGAVGLAGLGLGGYAMWDSFFGGGSGQNDPQSAVDDNGDPILDANGQPVMEEPQDSGGMLAAVGGLGGAAFLGMDLLDMGSGVADLFGGRGGDEDGSPDTRRSRRQEARADRRAARQETRATRRAPSRRPSPVRRAPRLAGRTGGRLGGVARLAGRAGGSVGRLAGRFGGRAAGFGGRLLKGGGPLAIAGAVAGLAADSGLFGKAGSLGKQLGQLGGAAASGAALGATVGSVVPVIGTAIGGAVGAVGGVAYSLFKDKGLRDRIGGLASSAGKWLNDEIAKPVEKFFSGIGRKVTDTAKSAGKWVYDHTARPVLGFFRDLGRWFNEHVIRPVRRAVSGILDWLKPFWEIFKGLGLFFAGLPAQAIQWVYDNLIQPMIDFLVGIGLWVAERATAIGGWIEDNVVGPIVNFLVGIGHWIAEKATSIGSWVYDNVIQPIVNFFVSIGRWIGARASAIGSWVEGNVVGPIVNFFASIGSWFASLPGRVASWVGEHVVDPMGRFFSSIGDFIRKLPARVQHWAHNLPGMSHIIDDNPDGAHDSGGEIAGAKDGRIDNLRILATAGEFMVRKREVDRPGMRAHLADINNGRFEPSALYAGLNANVSGAMLPVNAPVRAVASSTTVTNTNTRNAGLSVGDVTINNPVRERSDRSMRRALHTMAYTQDR